MDVIVILIPGFPGIRESTYAGLFFDLLGASYSITIVDGFQPGTMSLLLPFTLLVLSYYFSYKREQAQNTKAHAALQNT